MIAVQCAVTYSKVTLKTISIWDILSDKFIRLYTYELSSLQVVATLCG